MTDEFAVLYPMPKQQHPADPHPFAFQGGNLIADALTNDLALELSKRQKDIEGQRPMKMVVLNCWITETKEALIRSRVSTILARSASDRSAVDFVDDNEGPRSNQPRCR